MTYVAMKFILCVLYLSVAMCAEPDLWLFRRSNINTPQIYNNHTQYLSKMDPSKPTWFIIHGANSNSSDDIPNAKVILNETDSNVILVNWPIAAGKPVVETIGAMLAIAPNLASFINLLKTNGFNDARMKVVGFSLGAHFAGVACKMVKGGYQGAIIALDAPGLPFTFFPPDMRITKDDAAYVEYWHSGGVFGTMISPVGHRDHYLYGGIVQPGCQLTLEDRSCSHMRAWEVYGKLLAGQRVTVRRCIAAELAIVGGCRGRYEEMPRATSFERLSPGVFYMKY